jgi:hypothetical protein
MVVLAAVAAYQSYNIQEVLETLLINHLPEATAHRL